MTLTIYKQQIITTTHIETINYNNDTSVSDLIDLKKISGTQLSAKKIIKKYRNLARKKPYQRPPPRTETTEFDDLETIDYNNDTSINDLNDIVSNTKKGKNTQLAPKKILKKYKKIAQNKKGKTEDVTFIKQVPLHPRERMKRRRKVKTEITTPEDVTFVKQVPVHPRDRLKRKRKIKLENYDNLTKKSKGSDVTFIKQVPLHPRERLKSLAMVDDKLHFVREGVKPKHTSKTKKRIEKMRLTNDQIEAAINNSSMLMDGEFNFSPQKILNKKLIFDISMVDKETIIDKIIEGLDDPYLENDKYWIEHEPGSNYFTLRLEDGR